MKVYHFLIILFRVIKNLNKYLHNAIIDIDDKKLLKLCRLYKDIYINNNYFIYMGNKYCNIGYFIRTDAIKDLNLDLKKYKTEFINNDKVKSFLLSLMDRLYTYNDLTDKQKDKLNYIITREILKIK